MAWNRLVPRRPTFAACERFVGYRVRRLARITRTYSVIVLPSARCFRWLCRQEKPLMSSYETRIVRCDWIIWCLAAGISGCGQPPAATTEIKAKANVIVQQAPAIQISSSDWPMWRGPNEDGVSAASAVPTHWSETENIIWKAAIPGRGHSSPIVVGDRI